MGTRKPMSLDDEPRPMPSARALWGVVKWGCIGVGCVLAVVAFTSSAMHASALVGMACFLGIIARIAQAEEHYKP